jgi:hypothetical protein
MKAVEAHAEPREEFEGREYRAMEFGGHEHKSQESGNPESGSHESGDYESGHHEFELQATPEAGSGLDGGAGSDLDSSGSGSDSDSGFGTHSEAGSAYAAGSGAEPHSGDSSRPLAPSFELVQEPDPYGPGMSHAESAPRYRSSYAPPIQEMPDPEIYQIVARPRFAEMAEEPAYLRAAPGYGSVRPPRANSTHQDLFGDSASPADVDLDTPAFLQRQRQEEN